MSILLKIALITAAAGIGGTGIGGVISLFIRKDSQKAVSFLLSCAAGIMLGIVCFDLVFSAVNPDGGDKVNVLTVILSILVGYLTVLFLNNIIDRHVEKEVDHFDVDHPRTADDLGELIHSKHYDEHKKKNYGMFSAGIVMACAIALHNLPEGMVIGASYAKGSADILAGSGFIMAVVLGLHNIPEGMAISVPLIAGGGKKAGAVVVAALSGLPTVLGAVLGYLVGMISPLFLSISLGFASGAMLYVVFGELLPEAFLIWKSKLPAFGVLIGLFISMILVFA